MSCRVCIIDDEPWTSVEAEHTIDFSRFGFRYDAHYEDPLEALRRIPSQDYSLILVDIRMPQMDGLTLIERLKAAGVKARFAILSGYSDFDYARSAIRLGVEDYFVKPIDPEEIHRFLQRLSKDMDRSAPPENGNFDEVLDYVRLHLNEKLRLEDLSEALNYSRNYLCALFQKHLNTTFLQYLTGERLHLAMRLLSETTMSLNEIALRCGFGDQAYLSRVFRHSLNTTPNEYRRAHRAPEGERA